jgi:hypothetical protein
MNKDQRKSLHLAILAAYPDYSPLEKCLQFGLGLNLAEISSGKSLSDTVFALVKWAIAHDRVRDLLRALREDNPDHRQLSGVADELLRDLDAGTPTAADDETSHDEPQSLALVIGISQYDCGAPPNQKLRDDQFTHLAFAADDALAVHKWFSARGYGGPPPLLNGEASLRGILHSLDELRKQRLSSEQSVVVYFSGHGARDGDGRIYLVPADAKRDDLFATALWSKTFNNALEELGTDRLVVFLDTCHADIGTPGAKDAEFERFDPQGLTAGVADRGPFIVSSCMARQRSYEVDGQGVFTRHLLELLEFEDPEIFSEQEEIDVFDLFGELKKRVKETTRVRCKGATQEPFANFTKRTGIILAINERLRQERSRRRNAYIQALLECLISPVAGQPARVAHPWPRRIERRILDYLKREDPDTALKAFYERLDEGLRSAEQNLPISAEGDCRDLVKYFNEAYPIEAPQRRSGQPGPLPGVRQRTNTVSAPEPARDEPAPSVQSANLSVPAQSATTASVLGTALPVQAPPNAANRRVLQETEAKALVTPDMENDLRFYSEVNKLIELLTRAEGVGPQDVRTWMATKAPEPELEQEWERLKRQFGARFMKFFSAPAVNTLALRANAAEAEQ